MEFGHIYDSATLDRILWALPSLDDEAELFQLQRIQKSAARNENPQILNVGTPVWGDAKWLGSLYPRSTKQSDFLKEYSKQFSVVEVNSSFYAIPSKSSQDKWLAAVPDNFKFCPKFPQSISKPIRISLELREFEPFISWVRGFGPYLGVSFLQLPQDASIQCMPRLKELFSCIPRDLKTVVEFRNESFFKNQRLKTEVIDLLSRFHLGTVITDTAGHREFSHTSLSSLRVLIRFASSDGHPTDFVRLNQWVKRIKTWYQHGLKEIYITTHALDAMAEIELAKFLISRLNKAHPNLRLSEPQFYHQEQKELLF